MKHVLKLERANSFFSLDIIRSSFGIEGFYICSMSIKFGRKILV